MKKNEWMGVDGFPELLVGQYIVPNFMSNSVALRGSERHWVLISPGADLLDDWLHRYGSDLEISIVMPNAYHFMGVEKWREAFPGAVLYASEKAIPQLNDKGVGEISALETSAPELPDQYAFAFPPGHRGGDVWLCKGGPQGAWITCDSFLNYERLSNQPVARAMQKLLGAAPGLKMSQVVKWFILDERRAFKRWALDRLDRNPPQLLIPSHGEPEQSDDLSVRLRGLLEQRL